MQIQRIQKLITFSPQLFDLIEQKASKLGISFPEYIRSLAVNDIKQTVDYTYFLTQEEEEGVTNSIQDVKIGKYAVLKDADDISRHFKNLK